MNPFKNIGPSLLYGVCIFLAFIVLSIIWSQKDHVPGLSFGLLLILFGITYLSLSYFEFAVDKEINEPQSPIWKDYLKQGSYRPTFYPLHLRVFLNTLPAWFFALVFPSLLWLIGAGLFPLILAITHYERLSEKGEADSWHKIYFSEMSMKNASWMFEIPHIPWIMLGIWTLICLVSFVVF